MTGAISVRSSLEIASRAAVQRRQTITNGTCPICSFGGAVILVSLDRLDSLLHQINSVECAAAPTSPMKCVGMHERLEELVYNTCSCSYPLWISVRKVVHSV